MKLWISPIDVGEAIIAKNGGADIIDVKNPSEDSLGADFTWIIRAVKEAIGDTPMGAAIGDFDYYKPENASLAAFGAAAAGAEYIKIGLMIKDGEESKDLIKSVARSVKDFNDRKKVVAAAYSDFEMLNTISPFELLDFAPTAGADVVMVDTGIKDGRSTFEFLSMSELKDFVKQAKGERMLAALAGSLKFEDMKKVKEINPDVVGVRGVVCEGDRNSRISQEKVNKLNKLIRK